MSVTSKLTIGTTLLLVIAIIFTLGNAFNQQIITGRASSSNLPVYTDSLTSGWIAKNWYGGAAGLNLNNPSPVYAGTSSIAFTATAPWDEVDFFSPSPIDGTSYVALSFAAQPSIQGQLYTVRLFDQNGRPMGIEIPLVKYGGLPQPGVWKVYKIPLAEFLAPSMQIGGFGIADRDNSPLPALYIDQIAFLGVPPSPSPTCEPMPPQCQPGSPLGSNCPNPPAGGWCPLPSLSTTPAPTCVPPPACLSAIPACTPPIPPGGWCPLPTPTCFPRPICLDNATPCKVAEPPGGWCPAPSVTPILSCIPRPSCLDAVPKCPIAEPNQGWCPGPTQTTFVCNILCKIGYQCVPDQNNHPICVPKTTPTPPVQQPLSISPTRLSPVNCPQNGNGYFKCQPILSNNSSSLVAWQAKAIGPLQGVIISPTNGTLSGNNNIYVSILIPTAACASTPTGPIPSPETFAFSVVRQNLLQPQPAVAVFNCSPTSPKLQLSNSLLSPQNCILNQRTETYLCSTHLSTAIQTPYPYGAASFINQLVFWQETTSGALANTSVIPQSGSFTAGSGQNISISVPAKDCISSPSGPTPVGTFTFSDKNDPTNTANATFACGRPPACPTKGICLFGLGCSQGTFCSGWPYGVCKQLFCPAPTPTPTPIPSTAPISSTPSCMPMPPQCKPGSPLGINCPNPPAGGWCPSPSCIPFPPQCLNSYPKCLLPMPQGGWCPVPSVSPAPTCLPMPPQCKPGSGLGILCPGTPPGGWCPVQNSVTVKTNRTSYNPADTITVTIANNLSVPIFALDTKAGCSVLGLQMIVNGQWQNSTVAGCPLGRHAVAVQINPGQQLSATIKGNNGLFPYGTYRFTLSYSTAQVQVLNNTGLVTIYSNPFNVENGFCLPPPQCLNAVPKCLLPEPIGGWCQPKPTCMIQPQNWKEIHCSLNANSSQCPGGFTCSTKGVGGIGGGGMNASSGICMPIGNWCPNTTPSPTSMFVTPTLFCIGHGSCPTEPPTASPPISAPVNSGTPANPSVSPGNEVSGSPAPCSNATVAVTAVHKKKTKHKKHKNNHSNGLVSDLLKLIQQLLKLILHIENPPAPGPNPQPSPEPSAQPSQSPNPCNPTPSTQPIISQIIGPTLSPVVSNQPTTSSAPTATTVPSTAPSPSTATSQAPSVAPSNEVQPSSAPSTAPSPSTTPPTNNPLANLLNTLLNLIKQLEKLIGLLVPGGGNGGNPTPSPVLSAVPSTAPSPTVAPTATTAPSNTPVPTGTPTDTPTPLPSNTPIPSVSSVPSFIPNPSISQAIISQVPFPTTTPAPNNNSIIRRLILPLLNTFNDLLKLIIQLLGGK